ncbi:50S ribosomal protein L29 [Sulfuriferula plumbiphila]|uniref:Large ribosomal subunit protein uL29 n=1 Tax=Sulfuriferula plumbiphila TaxID=171865 RepID=A0A512LC11_9PROT|nr:50S ribosomal protein L29 [Sulfuriferula plumbiphila]BBP03301.1 50S ribosomal protein L29 [Sulfuriferula plumbiphila]GEP31932.1 50S ribosomal protein L29 [Sulfuriferula plumbiphila]
MNASELRAKSTPEIKQELLDLLRAQFSLRMQVATQQTSKTSELGKLRKNIARIHTIQRENELKAVNK